MTSIRRSWSWLAFAVGLAACSSESGTNDNISGQVACIDGTTLPCPCSATTQGTAMCVNGQWSTTCMCPTGGGTGGFSQGTGGYSAGTGGYAIGTGGIVGAGGIPVGVGGFVIGTGGIGGSDGGASNTGGTIGGGADGGPPSTGGLTGDGGTPSTGGAQSTGGATSTGGTSSTGGTTGDGGTPGTGGAQSTGGAPDTGGAPSTGGAQNTGGTPSTGGAPGTGGASTVGEPTIPAAPASCPTLATGNITVLGQTVRLWVGAKRTDVKGPVMFYWHGTGSSSSEAASLLGPALQEIQSLGGIVASFSTSVATGQTTGNNVWYTGDYQMADIILACAIQQLNVDTHQIYTAGCSAGGLQAGSMVYARANYLAGAMPNSGGNFTQNQFQSSTHTPSVITVHGGDNDFGGIFGPASTNLCTAVANRGGYATDCNHGGGHCQAPAALVAAQWTYLKAHPYGVTPDPYAGGLPSSFPNYCTQF